jgi:hypothetical protein
VLRAWPRRAPNLRLRLSTPTAITPQAQPRDRRVRARRAASSPTGSCWCGPGRAPSCARPTCCPASWSPSRPAPTCSISGPRVREFRGEEALLAKFLAVSDPRRTVVCATPGPRRAGARQPRAVQRAGPPARPAARRGARGAHRRSRGAGGPARLRSAAGGRAAGAAAAGAGAGDRALRGRGRRPVAADGRGDPAREAAAGAARPRGAGEPVRRALRRARGRRPEPDGRGDPVAGVHAARRLGRSPGDGEPGRAGHLAAAGARARVEAPATVS